MIMLWWMTRHGRNDKIKNECVWNKIGVAHIEKKRVESWLRWVGHVRKY